MIFLGVLAVSAVLCVTGILLFTQREPVYRGQPLSFWLEGYGFSGGMIPFGGGTSATPGAGATPSYFQATAAVRALGTNSLPLLLRDLQYHETPLENALHKLARKIPFLRVRPAPALPYDKNHEAETAFLVLGADALPGVPELIKIYESNPDSFAAQYVPVVLGGIGPSAREAVPMLSRAATNGNLVARVNSMAALARIHPNAQTVLPALVAGLRDAEPYVRANALFALTEYGAEARSAIPELLALIRSDKHKPAKETARANHSEAQLRRSRPYNPAFGGLDAARGASAITIEPASPNPILRPPLDIPALALSALEAIDPAAGRSAGVK